MTSITSISRENTRSPTLKFGGFEKGDGWTALKIPTIEPTTLQTVGSGLGFAPGAFDSTVAPETRSQEKTRALYSSSTIASIPKADAEQAYNAALRLENPTKHTSETIDCGSCHVSHTRQTAEANFGFTAQGREDRYDAELVGTGLVSSVRVHAFSYGEGGLQISQRTANETAAVVKYFNEKIVTR